MRRSLLPPQSDQHPWRRKRRTISAVSTPESSIAWYPARDDRLLGHACLIARLLDSTASSGRPASEQRRQQRRSRRCHRRWMPTMDREGISGRRKVSGTTASRFVPPSCSSYRQQRDCSSVGRHARCEVGAGGLWPARRHNQLVVVSTAPGIERRHSAGTSVASD